MIILRAKQLGFLLHEIDQMTLGEFTDVLIEQSNDSYEYPKEATQDDINKFLGG